MGRPLFAFFGMFLVGELVLSGAVGCLLHDGAL